MTTIHTQPHIENLYARMRLIRESRNLTLVQAAKLSNGEISAIALGSYERGDRSVSARKLLTIARLYEVPISELFEAQQKYMTQERVSLDLRKLVTGGDPIAEKITAIIRNIARMRGDWNGEVISLRSCDMALLKIFADYSDENTNRFLEDFALTKLK